MVSLKAKHRHEEKVWEIISGRSGITDWHNVQDWASEIPYSLYVMLTYSGRPIQKK